MSINGVGASGAADAGQLLARMLSRLDSTNSTQSNTNSTSSTANTGSSSAATESAASTALTGTGQAALSDQIMALLVQLQQQSSPDGAQQATPPTPPANDPVQQLFSAMDADGDGTVSQKEMETYVTGKGGTQAQADVLFSSLSQSASGQNVSGQDTSTGISEQQLGTDISQTQHAHHRHHHHGGGGAQSAQESNSGSDIAAQIFGAVDTNQDGTISSDELAAAFNTSNTSNTTNGTSASSTDSSALFSQIDSNGDGSVSGDELGGFLTTLAQQTQSDFNTLGMFGQLAAQSYDASAGLLNKTGSVQSSYA